MAIWWSLRQLMAAWGARLASDASAALRAVAGFLGAGKLVPKPPAEEAPKEPAENFPEGRAVDLGGGARLYLVLVPAGSLQMGSEEGDPDEKPVHEVAFAKPFYMGKYPVTQEQWQAVMGSNPSRYKGPKNAVETVSWDDCQEFLKKLNGKTGCRFALPSEAEWEYACRAGSPTEFCFGNDEARLGEYAWYGGNLDGGAHPVGRKRPNAWGLYDLHGNVWEWCEDVYHGGYDGAPADGSPWLRGGDQTVRVLRGGSWFIGPMYCRSAYRDWANQKNNWTRSGVRVVLRGL